MRVFFDTSVLVPALVTSHPRHELCFCWLEAAARGRVEGMASWHAAAETWAVLTRLPTEQAITGEQARKVVQRLRSKIKFVPVAASIYLRAMERCAFRGLSSGAVFDAIHLLTAERQRADILLTFDSRHFGRLAVDGSPRIVVPTGPRAIP